MHDIERYKEAEAFLDWLKKQIIDTQSEALIIAGDIFDTANPPVEARRLYYTFLASLCTTDCKNVIIIGGNHDSAIMLDSAKELLEVLNIHVVGSIADITPEQMCFELHDKNSSPAAICMAVPFVRETELRNYLDEESSDGDLYSKAYAKLYSDVYSHAQKMREKKDIPVIATGHLYAANLEGRLSNSASSAKTDDGVKVLDVLGTLGNVPVNVFPQCDYVALGHIHYSTMVAKNPRIRYSGSPFVMGFDEADIPHYILCVDAKKDAEPSVNKIETPRTAVYKRFTGTLNEIKTELQKITELKPEKHLYIELCYKKEIGVNAQDYLDETVSLLPKNVSVVSWKILDPKTVLSKSTPAFTSQEIKNLDDKEVFTQLILSKTELDKDSEEAKATLEQYLPLLLKIAEEV